jgi:broad specificity phosphatase PhoE
MSVVLVRHGEPDWHQVEGSRWRGAANDFAPLTAVGKQQALAAAAVLAADGAVDKILSSPMTRALETAYLMASNLGAEVQVDLNLREWLPDDTYSWTSVGEVAAAYEDMLYHGGSRPPGHHLHWEPLDVVRARAMASLACYVTGPIRVVAVCHEVLIHALTGCQRTAHAGQRTLEGHEG